MERIEIVIDTDLAVKKYPQNLYIKIVRRKCIVSIQKCCNGSKVVSDFCKVFEK